MNITNQEARAAAMTAYYAYEINPEVAKEIMFNFDEIRLPRPYITPNIEIGETEDKEVTDPGIKAYAELIERVAEIDVEAAAWMLFEAPKMKIPEEFEYIGYLYDCFVWSDTPQGEDFWLDISNKLDYDI